jgi:hypothetical protein
MARQAPDRATLVAMSEHVSYEWKMLLDLLPKLQALEESGRDEELRRATIESFLVHARQMFLFLYENQGQRVKPTDVLGMYYAPDWKDKRPNPAPRCLVDMKEAADTLVAHLTTKRADLGNVPRYRVEEWARELAGLGDSFLALAPTDLFLTRPAVPLSGRLPAATGQDFVTDTTAKDKRSVFVRADGPGIIKKP